MQQVGLLLKLNKCYRFKWVEYAWICPFCSYAELNQGHSYFLQQLRTIPNEHDYAGWLKDCARTRALNRGQSIHSEIVNHGLDSHPIIGSALVNMYSKCGGLEDACAVFDGVSVRDVVLWSSIIISCANHGHSEKGLHLFGKMQLQEGLLLDKKILMYGLKSCAGVKALDEGRRTHIIITKQGLEDDAFVGNSLVDMYCKSACIKDAQKVFDSFGLRDVVLWSALICGYVEASLINEAMQLFNKMHDEGVNPNSVTYECIIHACLSLETAQVGQRIYADIEKFGFFDSHVGVRLIHMFCSFGLLNDAHKVFSTMNLQDIVPWTVLIIGYVDQGHGKEALRLYQSMRRDGIKPDEMIFMSILQACSKLAAFREGQIIFFDVLSEGFDSLLSLKQSLMEMYMQCASPEDAHALLRSLPVEHVAASSVVIAGYASFGCSMESLKLFEEMQARGLLPNEVIYSSILQVLASLKELEYGKLIHNQLAILGFESDVFIRSTLIDMYGCCGRLQDAFDVFEKQSSDGDVVLCNTMIGVYVEHGYNKHALQLFEQLLHRGLGSGFVTMLLIIRACFDIEEGRNLHSLAVKHGCDKYIEVQNTVIGMYSKTGRLDDAQSIFKSLSRRSLASYNAFLAGESCFRSIHEALQIYHQMNIEGIQQDQSTFALMLKACAAFTSLHLGRLIYTIIAVHALDCEPYIASAAIDFYSKAGSLRDAVNLFDRLYSRDEASWNTVIAAYADNGCIDDAQNAFMNMLADGVGPGMRTFLCLLNVCSHAGIPELSYYYLQAMTICGMVPNDQLLTCLIDGIGRAGQIVEAKMVALIMPIAPSVVAWTTLWGWCMNHAYNDD